MKISVIIPIKDLGSKILPCLNSIYSQDMSKSDYEVLMVFDSCFGIDFRPGISADMVSPFNDQNFFLQYGGNPFSQNRTAESAADHKVFQSVKHALLLNVIHLFKLN